MNVNAFLTLLSENPSTAIHVMLPDRNFVPAHFHITEVGRVQKDFIDCGGTVRSTTACVLQVWVAQDLDHRINTTKLAHVMQLAAPLLKSSDLPIEVEYENGLLSQFPVTGTDVTPLGVFVQLGSKHTACLAPDQCGVGLTVLGDCATTGCC